MTLLILTVACLAVAHHALSDSPQQVVDYIPPEGHVSEGRILKMIHVVHRHGKRTPADTYKTDPYFNYTFEPFGWGALTNEGKKDMYNFGRMLRKRYDDFLGDIYHSKEYFVQTTDSDRTKMSAQLVNAGLWPPKMHQIWGDLRWQPIPSVYEPLNQDSLLLVRKDCPRYHEELKNVLNMEEIKNNIESYKQVFENLTAITGNKIEDPDGAQDLYSTLLAEETYGLDLPAWTQKYYPEPLKYLTALSFQLNAYNDELKRLKGGVLLKKILTDYFIKSGHEIKKRMDSFYAYLHTRRERDLATEADEAYKLLNEWKNEIKNTTPLKRKMVLYSGHDSTVANLMSALNVWEPQVPNYGIAAIMEFSEDIATGELGVQVYLWNNTEVPPYELTVPGCKNFCPLTKLTKLVEPVIPRNLEEECKPHESGYTQPPLGGP